MDTVPRRIAAAALAAVGLALLAACATPRADAPAAPPPPRLGDERPAPPDGEVLLQGTVIEKRGAPVQLCYGPMVMTYPPQCGGIPLDGWDWGAVEGAESAEGTTFGAYAVTGTYDGERIAVTADPVPLALFDPMAPEDPTRGVRGDTDEETLARVQRTVQDRLGDELLVAYPEGGRLRVQVLWDDGTYQDAADAEFGDDVVVVETLMQSVG